MGSTQDSSKGGHEAARVLRAAGEQIALALTDSRASVDELGASLRTLADLLAQGPMDAATQQKAVTLRAEMLRAVTGLQFYDRLTQHLMHVRDYLANGAAQIGTEGGVPEEPWASLHLKLADRLLSETHRMYLGRNFPADFVANRGAVARAERGDAAPGEIDLF